MIESWDYLDKHTYWYVLLIYKNSSVYKIFLNKNSINIKGSYLEQPTPLNDLINRLIKLALIDSKLMSSSNLVILQQLNGDINGFFGNQQ